MSKNRPTLEQISIACRHVDELIKADVTENHAIRLLELLCDVYAKILFGGKAAPHHVSHVPLKQWSKAARKVHKNPPSKRVGDYLRVEHGTPRRELARRVLDLYHKGKLSTGTLNGLIRKKWKLAVVTIKEDEALNALARSVPFSSPEKRWLAAGIKF